MGERSHWLPGNQKHQSFSCAHSGWALQEVQSAGNSFTGRVAERKVVLVGLSRIRALLEEGSELGARRQGHREKVLQGSKT